MNGARILVTGGSGFIGSHLVRRLLALGCRVGLLARYGNVMKNERLRDVWDRLEVIEADVRNRGALAAVHDFGPQVVFHLAAYNHVGESFRQVEECFDVNAKGTANLLDICDGLAERFVYVSSSEVYGHQGTVPFVESMCPSPISPYAITKYAGELYCTLKQRVGGKPIVIIVRPFNAFGPHQSTKAIIPELIINCLKGSPIRTTPGEQTREFNYVDNLVDGMVLAAQHPNPIEGSINLAGGKEVAIKDLVAIIANLTRTRSHIEIGALPYRPTEIWRMFADATKAREVLGWKAAIALEDGLHRTIDWFRGYLFGSGSSASI
jgi:UDP-glucose 4-epimerase